MKKNILQIFIIGCLFIGQLVFAQPESNTITGLPGEPAFIEPDFARDTIYVSVPDANQVLLFSSQTLQITNTITFTGNPYGLDLSNDGNTLYVGLSGTGTVAFVDLTDPNFGFTEIDVSNALSHQSSNITNNVFDVLEVGISKIFVSSNTGFGTPTNIAYIDRQASNSVFKAGYQPSTSAFEIIRSKPFLVTGPDQRFVYVNENSRLYKLDITSPNIPIISESGDFLRNGDTFLISNDGSLLYTNGGNIVHESTLTAINYIPIDTPTINLNNTFLYGLYFSRSNIASYSNPAKPVETGSVDSVCDLVSYSDRYKFVLPEQNDNGLYAFYGRGSSYKICYFEPDDEDADGNHDLADNCPRIANSSQQNTDKDHQGDACDDDDDNDGLKDIDDPFPLNFDGDGDGVSDSDDAFPTFDGAGKDTDQDGKPDQFHPQCDLSCQSASGLVEDEDDDNDGILDINDPQPLIPDQGSNPSTPDEQITIDLPGHPAFFEIDKERFLAYVSMPETNEVLFISLSTLEIVYSLSFEGEPQGLDLSDNGNTLYVGLAGTGTVAFVDLTNPTLDYIEVEVASGLSVDASLVTAVYDVLEAGNIIIVTANPKNIRDSNVISINKQNFNQVNKIANDKVIKLDPLLASSPDNSYVYIYEVNNSFGAPGSLYKLDVNLIDLPVIQEDSYGEIDGGHTDNFYSSNNGEKLFIGNGQIISTSTFEEITDLKGSSLIISDAEIASLTSIGSVVSQQIIVRNDLNIFDIEGHYQIGFVDNPCDLDITTLQSVHELKSAKVMSVPDHKGWLIKGNSPLNQLCFLPNDTEARSGFPQPGASLFPPDYFPLTDNLQWSYITDPSINTGFNSSVLPGTVMVNGEATKRINISTGETEYYSVSQAGVKLHRSADSELTVTYSPPLPMTPSNLAVGTSVTQSGTATSVEPGEPNLILDIEVTTQVENYEIVTLPENKEVEAFKIKQTQTYSFQGSQVGQIVQYYWYAKNIGLIKAHLERAPDNEISELVSTNDFDSDTIPDNIDPDDDNDGTPDTQDAFPFDPTESSDNDGDGTGDNADLDDDNDGVLDVDDNCPLVNNPGQMDSNIDGEGDACDSDDTDGDGVPDKDDAFPLDPTESSDNDGDGIGDNADLDDDNDQVDDEQDNCPLIANTDQLDQNQNGIGDVCEAINDCDFFVIGKITICL